LTTSLEILEIHISIKDRSIGFVRGKQDRNRQAVPAATATNIFLILPSAAVKKENYMISLST